MDVHETDLLELLFLTRRNIDPGAILDVRRSHHCANAGATASDHSCPFLLIFCVRACTKFSFIRTDLSFHIEETGYCEIYANTSRLVKRQKRGGI